MNYKKLNPKAKEMYARSLIDNGGALFKAVFLTMLIFPVTLIFQLEVSSNSPVSWLSVLQMSPGAFWTALLLIFIGITTASYLQHAGFKMLHLMEQETQE